MVIKGGDFVLSQALEVFKKEYEKKGDAYILDSYIPADGTYVVVMPSDEGFVIEDIFDIKFDSNKKEIDRTISKYFDFVCFADYLSQLISTNKAIYVPKGRAIHGNNYLSFIIKKESITNGKLTNKMIDKYYDILENPTVKYKGSQETLKLYELVKESVGEVDKKKLNKIKLWIKENLFGLSQKYPGPGKDYLKIFFYYPQEDYKKESERYFIPNIYNKNDYNREINGTIFGLPDDNMGLNNNKPYLKNQTRKIVEPYLINIEEVMYQKMFFNYLMNQTKIGHVNVYIDDKIKILNNKSHIDYRFSGIFLRTKKIDSKTKKEVGIVDYDTIINYNPQLTKVFEYKNIIGIDYDKLNGTYGTIKTLNGMHQVINEIMFSKFLSSNFFTEPKDISINDGILKSNLLMCRTALFNWFFKGNGQNIWILLNKASLSLVKGSVINGYMTKASDQLNLRLSLKEYYEGGEEMADVIFDLKNNLRVKISQKNTSYIENDREYFFAVGQLVSYFISRSKGKKKPLSLANPVINAKKDKAIKDKLKALYKKYNYDIESHNIKFKSLYAMVMSYEIKERIDEDIIIAGYLHSNLLYESAQNNKEVKDNE